MSYPNPATVLTPRSHVDNVRVLYDKGEDEFSIASLTWGGEAALGIRWNGGEESPIGNPQSRGYPTWFIIPPGLHESVKEFLAKEKTPLQLGYEEMARDEQAEADATAWSDHLIGDAKGSAHEAW